MPGRDGTGPAGMGRMTGRGMGCCAGYAAPGYSNVGFGRGRGQRFGRMCRHEYGFPPYVLQGISPEADEKEVLQKQADALEKRLVKVRERLENFK